MKTKKYTKDIMIVKRMLKTKLWKQTTDQKQKWDMMLKLLCKRHGIKQAKLHVNPLVLIPYYNPAKKDIVLPKFSLISFLHEFRHHYHRRKQTKLFPLCEEHDCKDYSEYVFRMGYPSGWKKLKRDKRGYLIKKK